VVGRAIRSCLAQTVQDFEIIIVDDHSSEDGIREAIAPFSQANIRLIEIVNGSAAKSRNRGVEESRGKYVAYLDSDDQFLPKKLETCLSFLGQNPGRIAYSSVYTDRGSKRLWIKPPRAICRSENIFDYLFIHYGQILPSTVVLEASAARENPFDEKLFYGDDVQFAADLWLKKREFRMMDEPLVLFDDKGSSTKLSQDVVNYTVDSPRNRAFVEWVEARRPQMSEAAYHAYRARHLARMLARTAPVDAFRCVWEAYQAGTVGFFKAASQLVQVYWPTLYRELSNLVAARAGCEASEVVRRMQTS
jgi:glycosyltransferase involved in cell wall biosynthesis